MTDMPTWHTQVAVADSEAMMKSLRAAGLPLANAGETSDDESGQSQIVCIAGILGDIIHAVIATPSGFVYRFEPSAFELSFWSFAARNYYWITYCAADRQRVSELTNVPMKSIKGRTLSRTKSEPSQMPLDKLLAELGMPTANDQQGLF